MSIYDEIGGLPAVAAAVDDFYDRVLGDERVSHHFDGHRVERLKGHQRTFLITALGGPQIYRGRDMQSAHAHLGITGEDFDIIVEHLVATLTHLGVPGDTIGQIGGALAPLKDQIVAPVTTG